MPPGRAAVHVGDAVQDGTSKPAQMMPVQLIVWPVQGQEAGQVVKVEIDVVVTVVLPAGKEDVVVFDPVVVGYSGDEEEEEDVSVGLVSVDLVVLVVIDGVVLVEGGVVAEGGVVVVDGFEVVVVVVVVGVVLGVVCVELLGQGLVCVVAHTIWHLSSQVSMQVVDV